MPEKLIPVSKKQHDAINFLSDAIKANQTQLSTVANVILMGEKDDYEQVGVVGARHVPDLSRSGSGSTDAYYLVIEVPDIAPPAEVESA